MEKQLKKKTREAGNVLMVITGAILGYIGSADEIISELDDEVDATELETSEVYQILKTAKAGLQRTLDEMNEVFNKMTE